MICFVFLISTAGVAASLARCIVADLTQIDSFCVESRVTLTGKKADDLTEKVKVQRLDAYGSNRLPKGLCR